MTRSFEPGANVSALVREIGIKPSQLFGWRSEAVRSGKVARCDETGCTAQDAVSSGTTIEIAINGMTVRVGDGVGEDRLRRVLRAVRSA